MNTEELDYEPHPHFKDKPRPPYCPEHLPWPPPKIPKKDMGKLGYPWRVWWPPVNPRRPNPKYDMLREPLPSFNNNYFANNWKDPNKRIIQELWRSTGVRKAGRPMGSTEGYNKKERDKIKKRAKAEAIQIVQYMMDKGHFIPKQDYAKEAMETAVAIMRREDVHPKDKLAASKVVLEWTMSKPATETNVNVKTAESFLEEIAQEMGLPPVPERK